MARPRYGAAFLVALSGTLLLWLPLTVLPILDGLLFTATPLEVARDLALLALAGVIPAFLLGLLACGGYWLASRWRPAQAPTIGWTLMLLPLLWICARQFARMALAWIGVMRGEPLQLGADLKLGLLALSVAALLLLFWRLGWNRMLGHAVQLLSGASRVALGVLVLATGLVVAQPPAWVPMATRAADPGTRPPAASANANANAPHIILITLDTVSALDARPCDPASSHMPRLAKFAQQSTCFERFYTASNFTTASTSTMESGLLPWTHHATQPDAPMTVATRTHTLAQVLREQGWRTHSVTDNLLGSPRHRGSFAAYDSSLLSETGLVGNLYREAAAIFPDTALPRLFAASLAFLSVTDSWLHHQSSPYVSERVYGDVLALLAQEKRNGRPQFVWALTLPPHSPYLPPASTRYQLLPAGELDKWSDLLPDNIEYPASQQGLVDKHRLRYQESMRAADASLAQFLEALERSGWLDRSIVVITSDHGESFERGFLGHAGPHLHEALIRAPLVVRLPGQREGRRITQVASQADLAPTLLDLVGAAPLSEAEGRSLRPLLEGAGLPDEPVFSMAMERQSRFRPIERGHFAVIDAQHKLLFELPSGKRALYRLDLDPGETRNLAEAEPAQAQRLQSLLLDRLARAESRRRRDAQ